MNKEGDTGLLEEEPATQAETRARDAVKRGRLRVRKDGREVEGGFWADDGVV